MVDKVIFLTATGAGTWPVPADWTNTNKVETIGAGAGGKSNSGGGGGGGGAYSSRSNITTFTPGSTVVNFSVGAGGAAGAAGGDTWFGATTLAASLVGAKGGATTTTQAAGLGGASASGFPTSGGVRNSGGDGGFGGNTATPPLVNGTNVLTGGGGGGAAGPGGAGGAGGRGDPATAGNDFGGGGGGGAGSTGAGQNGGVGGTTAGAAGTGGTGGGLPGGAGGSGSGSAGSNTPNGTAPWTSTHATDATTASVVTASPGGGGGGAGSAAGTGANGSSSTTDTRGYGGGGGGGGAASSAAGSGIQGLIVITYTAAATIAATSVSFSGSSALAASTTGIANLGTPAKLTTLPPIIGRAPENRVRDCNDLSTAAWERAAGVTCTPNYGTTTAENGQTVPTCRLQTTATWQTLKQHLVAPGGRTHYTSFWARSLTGAQQRWGIYDGSFVNYLFIETTWTLVGLAHTNQTIDITSQLIGDGPGDIETFGWEDNLGSARSGFAGLGFPKIGGVADVVNGLVGRYPLEANANATVGVNGTAFSSFPTFASGYATFNGTNQSIKIADTFNRAGLTKAFSVWFRATDSDGPIIGQMGAGNIPAIGLIAGGKVSATWWGGVDKNVQSPGGFADGMWHHVVWQFNSASGGTSELFVDGVSRGSVSGALDESWWFETYIGYSIGAGGGGTRPNDEYFTGSIDDFRVYDRALTQAEITALTYSRGEPYGPRAGLGLGHPNTFINLEDDLVTLSDGGKTATITGNVNRSPTVLKSVSDRPIYWEAVSQGKNAQGWSGKPGFARSNCPIDYLSGVGTVVVDPDGKVWLNNVHWAWTDANWIGDRICFAVDPQNRQFWVRVNNGNWTGWTTSDPASRTGGLPLDATDFPLPVYPACYLNNTGDSVSIYTSKADWTLTPPLGYGEIPVTTTAVTFDAGTPAKLTTLPPVFTPRYLGEQRYPHLEQYVLEQINIYRANPPAFSQGVGFSASAPVILSPKLLGAARAHNMWEISNDIFQHDEEVGIGIPEQVTRYDWFLGRSGSFGIFQNHQWSTTVGRTQKQIADDFMENYRNSPAHNSNILDTGHKEVGSAFTYIADGGAGTAGEFQGFTDGWWNTQDFGSWTPDAVYLTGVVYNDTNGNGLYDIGEGITGAIIEATDSGSTVRTATSRIGGGFELALPAGVHGVRVSKDGGSTWTTSQNVTIGTVNVKFDKAYVSAATASAFAGSTALSASVARINTTLTLLAGSTTLAASAARILGTSAAFSGSGSFAASETGIRVFGSPFAGASSLAASAAGTLGTSPAFAGSGSFATPTTGIAASSPLLSGFAVFAPSTAKILGIGVPFAGSSSLAAQTTAAQVFGASLSGSSVFAPSAATGGSIQATSTSFSGSTALAGSAALIAVTSPAMAGSTALGPSDGRITTTSFTTQGSGSFTAFQTVVVPLGSAFSGSSSLTASDTAIKGTSASFAGAGAFAPAPPSAANWGVVTWIEFSGTLAAASTSASFAGSSALAASISKVLSLNAAFGGAGAFSAGVAAIGRITTLFVGSSTFAVSQTGIAVTSWSLTGSSVLAASLTNLAATSSSFAGSSSLVAPLSGGGGLGLSFTGSGALASSLRAFQVTSVSLSGSSNLAASASAIATLSVTMAGSSTFAAPPTGIQATSAILTGASSLTAFDALINRLSVSYTGASAFAPSDVALLPGGTSPGFAGASAFAPRLQITAGLSVAFNGSSTFGPTLSLFAGLFSQFSGSSTLTASETKLGTTSLTTAGSSVLAPSAGLFAGTSLSASGSGALAPFTSFSVQGTTSPGFQGSSALAPRLTLIAGISVSMAGAGSFAPAEEAGTGIRATSAAFNGASSLAASIGTGVVSMSVAMAGSSVLAADVGTGVLATAAILAGATNLVASLRQTAVTSPAFAGAGNFGPAAILREPITPFSVSFTGAGSFAAPPGLFSGISVAFNGATILAGSMGRVFRTSAFFLGSTEFAASIVDLESISAPVTLVRAILEAGLYDPTKQIAMGSYGTDSLLAGTYDPEVELAGD